MHMKTPFLMILAAGFVLTANTSADDSTKDDKKAFEGTWSLVSVEINMQPLEMDKLKGAKLVIKGASYSFMLGKTRLELTYEINPTKEPKHLDLTIVQGLEKGQTYHAIYKLEGNRLTICRHTEPGKARPSTFATEPASGLMLTVWQRDKN
jgi:uncharacterized protein (TIGR03067 family)